MLSRSDQGIGASPERGRGAVEAEPAPGARLTLLPERAALWTGGGERALLVADVHLGKDAAFRSWGAPAPAGPTEQTLARLEALVRAWEPTRLIVLGDLVHARAGLDGPTVGAVEAWSARARAAGCAVSMVRGNHDRKAGALPASWRVEDLGEEARVGPFVLRHEPGGDAGPDGLYALCGHVHPVVRLRDGAGCVLRAPCFWLGPGEGVLPAFGSFTGGSPVRARAGDRVFVACPGEVVEVRGVVRGVRR